MTRIIQFLVDEGVFVEDPDGLLWLSAKMKDVIKKLEQNEKFLDQLREIEDAEDRAVERWITAYLAFTGGAKKEEAVNAVAALATWEIAAMDRRRTEWSMKLRIR